MLARWLPDSSCHSRRVFLKAAASVTALGLGCRATGPAMASPGPSVPGKAKSTILFFLSGGASHLDMWDMKPMAPLEYRGPFEPRATSAPGLWLCEHLPMLGKQAHHLALVPSVGGSVSTNDHHAGYYYHLTGQIPDPTFLSQGNDRKPYPDDYPFFGSVIDARRPPHNQLTNAITLPEIPGAPMYTRPGQFAGRLGVAHDPLVVRSSHQSPMEFRTPSLALEGPVTPQRLLDRKSLSQRLDRIRRQLDSQPSGNLWHQQQERAMHLLMSSSTTAAMDLTKEPESVLERYGKSVNGMSLLIARRLVEAGVPFIAVFWMGDEKKAEQRKCASGGGWDTHGNNFECLKEDLLPEFDRGFSALIEDLANRQLLGETLVLVTSEMGRKPKIGDPRSGGPSGAGRDHWTHCLTDVLAGGGIRGGQVYGSSDRLGEYPALNPVSPSDIVKTVYHAMGVSNLQATDAQGRPFAILEEGKPIEALF